MAVALALASARAQEIPYPTDSSGLDNGNLNNPSGQAGQINCADPLMASSYLCGAGRGATGGGVSGGMFNGQSPYSQLPGYQQGQSSIYSDDQGRLTYPRSTFMLLPPEPLTEFQKFVSSTTGMVLPIFGADLFRSVPSTFAPLDNAPVPADYVIGPDDLVRLRVWGQANVNANLRVDRSGNIFVPQVGSVQVAGLKFGDLDQALR
jgi:hypothetical protein